MYQLCAKISRFVNMFFAFWCNYFISCWFITILFWYVFAVLRFVLLCWWFVLVWRECSCFVPGRFLPITWTRVIYIYAKGGVAKMSRFWWGVVFVHHSCKKDTLLQNYHISRPFLRLTEAISVEKHNKNNNLAGKIPQETPKCSDQWGAGEGHRGVWGNVYMYKHTEVDFWRTTIGCIRMYIHHIMLQIVILLQKGAWLGAFPEYNCGAGAALLHLSVLTLI